MLVKRSHTRRVLRGAWTPPGSPTPIQIYLKRYKIRTPLKALIALVVPPKGPREFQRLAAARARGIPCPRPLLWAVMRRGGLPAFSCLAVESLGEDVEPLRSFLEQCGAGGRAERLEAAARFLRAAHDRGFYHDDCSAEHIVVNSRLWRERRAAGSNGAGDGPDALRSGLFAFLDVDNARLGRAAVGDADRLKNIAQVWRSFGRKSALNASDWTRFWSAYWGTLDPPRNAALIRGLNRIALRKTGRPMFNPDAPASIREGD
ncbi:MAG: hypothetical protein Kow0059_01290 [Candidatus Sumerlaeia bacterium]